MISLCDPLLRVVNEPNEHERRLVHVRSVHVRSFKLTEQMNEQEMINEQVFLFMFVRLTNYIVIVRIIENPNYDELVCVGLTI